LEAKFGTLNESLKNLALAGQIWTRHLLPDLKLVLPSDYYMFKTLKNVVISAAMTRAQSVSRATLLTMGKSVESLQTQNNGHEDQIGQARLSLFFGLEDVVQFVSGHNSSLEALNLAINMVHTSASKVLYTL
jgi:hypothetical protein